MVDPLSYFSFQGVRCSSVVRVFAHGAMGRWIVHSWGGPIELFLIPAKGERCSSVVRAHGAMGRWIDHSWGGPTELFLVPASAPRLVYQRQWYVLSCLWDGAYKRTLAVNQKE